MQRKIKILVCLLIFLLSSFVVLAKNYNNPLTRSVADSLYCRLTGCSMLGDIDMGGFNIINATYVNMTYVYAEEIINLDEKIANKTIIRNTNTSWVLTMTDWFNSINFTTLLNSLGYKKENLTIDYPNLDTDKTDDFTLDNLTNADLNVNSINSSQYFDSSKVLHLSFNNNTLDSSDYGNDGTNHNAVLTEDVAEFDGVGDYIQTTVNLSGYLQATFSIWINPLNWGGGAARILTTLPSVDLYFRYLNTGKIDTFIRGLSNIVSTSSGTIQDNRWTLFTFVYNGTAKIIYLNGVFDSLEQATGNFNITNFVSISKSISNSFNGSIDEVKIYNRALSQAEIQREYAESSKNVIHANKVITNKLTVVGNSSVTGNSYAGSFIGNIIGFYEENVTVTVSGGIGSNSSINCCNDNTILQIVAFPTSATNSYFFNVTSVNTVEVIQSNDSLNHTGNWLAPYRTTADGVISYNISGATIDEDFTIRTRWKR